MVIALFCKTVSVGSDVQFVCFSYFVALITSIRRTLIDSERLLHLIYWFMFNFEMEIINEFTYNPFDLLVYIYFNSMEQQLSYGPVGKDTLT